MMIDCLQKFKESNSMFRIIFKVLGDHIQCTFEDCLHNPWDLVHHMHLQLLNDSRKQRQDFRIPCTGNVAFVISQNGIQHGRDEALCNGLRFRFGRSAPVDEHDQQSQHLLLCRAHGPDQRHLRRNGTLLGHGVRYVLGVHAVHVEHVHEEGLQLMGEETADGSAHSVVGFEDLDDLLDRAGCDQRIHAVFGLVHDHPPRLVRQLHELRQQLLPLKVEGWAAVVEHATDCLVECLHLVRLQIGNDGRERAHQLGDEGHAFVGLYGDEFPFAFGGNFQEGVARHVLNARMDFVHELEQLVDYGFEELPVRLQESRVLPDDVHDVGSHDGLVVFPPLLLAKPQQVLDDRDKEPFFFVFRHRSRYAADGPAKRVEIVPAPS
mmetsp:Transcript_1809/g.4477  ORF Transcript_1809/g.4477 Transcript_1809/m.4477 type:complete len:378 (-) Transcript_1809:786-1919(-)